jgi:hypothetical protein
MPLSAEAALTSDRAGASAAQGKVRRPVLSRARALQIDRTLEPPE